MQFPPLAAERALLFLRPLPLLCLQTLTAPPLRPVQNSAGKNRKNCRQRKGKEKTILKKTEEEISRLEERNTQIDYELTLKEVYSSSVKCQELAQEKSENEARLEELYERWAELEI